MKDWAKQYAENYLNKIDIGYRLPADVKLEELWQKVLEIRQQKAENIALKDQKGTDFWFSMPHILQKKLHEIDSYGRDSLYSMVKKEIESELIKESLIEEGFYSSVIEGAFSTLKKARELAENRQAPADKSEQMILNNFYAMRFILENKDKELSEELILNLHKIVCEKTMTDASQVGKLRDDWVYIVNAQGETIYTPPSAAEIPQAMQHLVDWANKNDEKGFVHPIIKASILHFYFVYLHPFFDGNGRTARALFYFYLIKNQYDFFKYFSISSIINSTRGQYYKSIKDVEDYDSDLTYFLLYISEAILKAIAEIKQKISEHYQKDCFLSAVREKKIVLNSRQEKAIKKLLLWSKKQIDIEKYQQMGGIVYQTARSDLLDLKKKQVLVMKKEGKKYIFTPNFEFFIG